MRLQTSWWLLNEMKKLVILILVIATIGSCEKKKDSLSDSISGDVLLLYSHNNTRLQEISDQNCGSDCQLLYAFAQEIRETIDDLMTQCGGVNEYGEFLNPYRKGDIALLILERNAIHQSASNLVDQLDKRDALPSNIQKIKNIINFTFIDQEGSMNLSKVKQEPLLFICLEMLILENLVYAQLIEG